MTRHPLKEPKELRDQFERDFRSRDLLPVPIPKELTRHASAVERLGDGSRLLPHVLECFASHVAHRLRFTRTVKRFALDFHIEAEASNGTWDTAGVREASTMLDPELLTIDHSHLFEDMELTFPADGIVHHLHGPARRQVVHEKYEDIVPSREAMDLCNLVHIFLTDDGVEREPRWHAIVETELHEHFQRLVTILKVILRTG